MDVIDRFKQRRAEIDGIREHARGQRAAAPAFKTWRQRTQRLIDDRFGDGSKESKRFDDISFAPYIGARVYTPNYQTPDPDPIEPFLSGCDSAQALLDGIIADMEDGGIPAAEPRTPAAHDRVVRILDRFHRVACQLRRRQRERPTFEIGDEYDVQDLLHALLKVDFDDVRDEEPTPSSAGGGSRLDFLLKNERIVIEVKMTRPGLTDAKLREELGADITHYAVHPDCGALYCIVYDPNHRVKKPTAIEADLSVPRNDVQVTVIIRPQE